MVQIIPQISLLLAALSVLQTRAHPLVNAELDNRSLVSPPSKDVTIDNIVYGGTGCPQGSASVEVSPDNKSFSVRFRKFTATLGTGYITDSRKFCQLNLDLQAPTGWQYTVVAANFTGYALLGPDTKATHTSTLYFSGSANQTSLSIPLPGPANYGYNIQTAAIIGQSIWSPCGNDAALNIKSELSLTGSGIGFIAESGQSGQLTRIFGLGWRKC